MGISLWIMPASSEAEKLKRLMDNPPSLNLNEPAAYPSFSPHITLGSFDSSIPLDDLRASLPILSSPLRINFVSVCVGDHYFRSVFVAVENTPELTHLHSAVHDALRIEPRTPRFPHMSLYYIEDSKAAERQFVLDRLWENGHLRSSEDARTAIVCRSDVSTNGETGDLLPGFDSTEVWIARCDGPVETWTILDKISIRSK